MNEDITVAGFAALPAQEAASHGLGRPMQDGSLDALSDGVVVREAGGKGLGIYADRPFAVGELVVRGRVERAAPHRTRHSFQKDWELHVELDETARSINHSCVPNTGVVDNTLGGYDFVALVPIPAGQEITWDYETTEYESIAVEDCLCGSPECRGRTRGFRYRTDPIRYLAAYLRSRPHPVQTATAGPA